MEICWIHGLNFTNIETSLKKAVVFRSGLGEQKVPPN